MATIIRPESPTFSDAGTLTITLGGTSQTLFSADEGRVYLVVQNHSSAALWLNFEGAAATQASPSIKLGVDKTLFFEGVACPTSAVTIIGPTTGQSFTAKAGTVA